MYFDIGIASHHISVLNHWKVGHGGGGQMVVDGDSRLGHTVILKQVRLEVPMLHWKHLTLTANSNGAKGKASKNRKRLEVPDDTERVPHEGGGEQRVHRSCGKMLKYRIRWPKVE